MPTVRVELEDHEIRKEIAKHGYGFQLSRNYPIWLTVADTSQPRRGGHYPRKALSPLSEAKYLRIRQYAESAKQAAIQVIELSHGRLTDPDLPSEHSESSAGSSIDPATLKSVVASAVANEVANVTDKMQRQIESRDQQIESLRRTNESLRDKAAKLLEADGKKGKKGKKAAKPAPEDEPEEVVAPSAGAGAADIG